MKKLLFLLYPFILLACEGDFEQTLPESSARDYELLIVTTGDANSTSFRRDVMMALYQPIPNLPREENLLAITFIDHSHFSNLYRRHSNILFISVNKGNDAVGNIARKIFSKKNMQNMQQTPEQGLLVAKDAWASPQQVIYATAADTTEMLEFIRESKDHLVRQVEKFEDKRLEAKIYSGKKKTIKVPFEKNHGFSLKVPSYYAIGEQLNKGKSKLSDLPITDYYWLRNTEGDLISDLMVYIEPYEREEQLQPEYILKLRDTVTRVLVNGPDGISYMGRQDVPETIDTVYLNGSYAVETRGLWGLFGSGEKMGGPFLNYTVLDTVNNQVITLDGFIWAPGKKKRAFVKRHEVIFSTLNIINK